MISLHDILFWAQIATSIILIILIALQQRGTALGSTFGGSGGGEFYSSRRGIQKKLYIVTIIFAGIFIVLSLTGLMF